MAGVLHTAANWVNTSTAGLTGVRTAATEEPGAPLPASETELLDHIPTEFGGLTHLFGGEANPTQYTPVNTARAVPAGSLPGRLGGLVPDARNTAAHAVEAAKAKAPAAAPALTAAAKDWWLRGRKALGL